MKNELQKICANVGIAVIALVIVAMFILTPIAFIYNWYGLIKTLLVFIDIIFYILICGLIYCNKD